MNNNLKYNYNFLKIISCEMINMTVPSFKQQIKLLLHEKLLNSFIKMMKYI